MKQKIKLFLSLSVLFGCFMGVLLHDVIHGVIQGISFGLILTVILSIYQRINIKKLGLPKGEAKVDTSVELEIEGTKREIFEICEYSVKNIVNCKIKESNFQEGIIKVRAGMTWLTWGDVMLFKLEQVQDNKFRILVRSRPLIKTTIIDFGKNQDNINRIIKYIKAMNKDVKVIQDG